MLRVCLGLKHVTIKHLSQNSFLWAQKESLSIVSRLLTPLVLLQQTLKLLYDERNPPMMEET